MIWTRARRSFAIAGTVFTILIAIIAGLPIGVGYYLERWLEDQGVASPSVGNVDINLFTGQLRFDNIQAGSAPDRNLRIGEVEVDLAWLPLLQGRVLLNAVTVANGKIDIMVAADGSIRIGELRPLQTSSNNDEPASTTLPAIGSGGLKISNVVLSYHGQPMATQISIDDLVVGRLTTWEPDQSTPISLRLRSGSGALSIKGGLRPLTAEPEATFTVSATGITAADYQALADLAGLNAVSGRLQTNAEIHLRLPAGGPVIHLTTEATFEDLQGSLDALTATIDGIHTTLTVDYVSATNALRIDGDIDVTGASATIDGTQHVAVKAIHVGELSLTGSEIVATRIRVEHARLTETRAPDSTAVGSLAATRGIDFDAIAVDDLKATMTGLSAAAINVQTATLVVGSMPAELGGSAAAPAAGQSALPLVSAAAISISQLTASETAFAVVAVEVDDMNLLAQYHPGGNRIGKIVVRQIEGQFTDGDSRVTVDSIDVSDTVVYVAREADGRLLYTEVVTDLLGESTEPAPDAAAATSAPPGVRVGQLRLNGARFEITDHAVTPPLVTVLEPVDIRIDDLDTTRPEHPVSISLRLMQGDLTAVTATGKILPFAERPTATLEFKVDALQLPQLGAYLPAYTIARGRLGLVSQVDVAAGILDVKNAIVIDDLRLRSVAGKDIPGFADTLAMPLDIALDLLRDGDGRITLDIPVTGDLTAPKIGFADIISTAIGKAMQKAAFTYVKNALQPLGTILFIADLAGKASRPSFEPVIFDVGETTLRSRDEDYLKKMAGLLQSRPGLSISICGVATAGDRRALSAAKQVAENETAETLEAVLAAAQSESSIEPAPAVSPAELIDLANRRAAAVQSFLIGNGDIEPDRIFGCSSAVDESDDAIPGVQMTL